MTKLAIATIAAAALSGAALGSAGSASATGADVTVNELQSQGYSVRLNGAPSAPLTACTVTNVSGPRIPSGAARRWRWTVRHGAQSRRCGRGRAAFRPAARR